MTGVEVLAGVAVAYLVRKMRRVGTRADAEVDRALDAGMDALHELVSDRLGDDGALERLETEAQAGTETERTMRRTTDAIAQAALDDDDFAARLTDLVEALEHRAAEASESTAGGTTYNRISGGTQYGPVFQGRDFTGPIITGLTLPSTTDQPAPTPAQDTAEGDRGK